MTFCVQEKQQEFEEECKELQQTVTELDEENDKLKSSLSSEKQKCLQLEKKLEQYMDVLQKLEVAEKERERLKHEVSQLASSSGSDLKEERLKLQLELESLRSSMSKQLKSDNQTQDKKTEDLICQLEESQQRETSLKQMIEVCTCRAELGWVFCGTCMQLLLASTV